jgi:aspartate aminotransferase-like enzyme
MLRVGPYVFKRAETDQEFEQIHCLNFRTFVSEIPQHPDPGTGRLIDKYHHKNAYIIVLHEGRVIGMVSGHDQPPFSVAERLSNPGILESPGRRPLEVRLLAIEPDKRNSTVCFGLLCVLYDHAEAGGYTHLYISGLKERVSLYQRLGFEPLGPAVPCGSASFVPMAMTIGQLPPRVQRTKHLWEEHVERVGSSGPEPVCLLPGPVTVAPAVRAAFQQSPIYHRGPEFIRLFQKVRRTLGELVGRRGVALLNGSGTLANEAVAACLAADPHGGRGVLLVNGEFGRRLSRQALRFGLQPRILNWPWGQPWDLDEVDAALGEEPPGSWVWGVHLESSTGVLNDLPELVRLARARRVRVCVDCISSLGAVPIDLGGVYLATGATGKSLGSYAGVAIVFAHPEELGRLDMAGVPSYFDIPAALENPGPRYTFPSPTLLALDAALTEYATPPKAQARYARYAAVGEYVREELRRVGIEPLAADAWVCPVVTTFAPPAEESSADFVARCRSWGFAIGGQSSYLAERRFVQIATMGAVAREDCAPLFARLSHWLAPQSALSAR